MIKSRKLRMKVLRAQRADLLTDEGESTLHELAANFYSLKTKKIPVEGLH